MKIIYDTETSEFGILKIQPVAMPQLNLIEDTTLAIDKNIWLHLSGKRKFLAVRLEEVFMVSTPVRITTDNEDVVLRPLWVSNRTELDCPVKFDCRFTPEENQNMWIIHHLHDGGMSAFTSHKRVESYRDVFHNGFNNIFDDGRICVGNARVPSVSAIAELGMAGFVNEWLRVWGESPFNEDLVRGRHVRTLKFDPDTLENVKIGEGWEETYGRFSPEYENDDRIKVLRAITAIGGAL